LILRHAEQAIAGFIDDGIDASKPNERGIDNLVDPRGVGHIEHFGVKRLRITLEQIDDRALVPGCSDDAVAALKELIGKLTAEAATPREHLLGVSHQIGCLPLTVASYEEPLRLCLAASCDIGKSGWVDLNRRPLAPNRQTRV
jgi:hypothetical protein